MKKLFWTILSFCLFIMQSTAYAEDDDVLVFDTELALSSDDNLNLATKAVDSFDDTFILARAAVSKTQKLNTSTLLSYFTKFEYQAFQNIDTLNNASLKFGLTLRHKPSAGFTKPTYAVTLDMALSDSDSDIRDSTFYNINAQLSKNITTKISSSFGIQLKVRDSDSRVYDITTSSLFININLELARSAALYTTYRYIDGDSVSSLDISNPVVLDITSLETANDIDTAFGNNFLAYRVPTKTHVMTLGLNYVVAGAQSIDFSIQSITSKASSTIDYDRTIMNLSYLARF